MSCSYGTFNLSCSVSKNLQYTFNSYFFGVTQKGRAIRYKSSLFLRQAVGFSLLSLTRFGGFIMIF